MNLAAALLRKLSQKAKELTIIIGKFAINNFGKKYNYKGIRIVKFDGILNCGCHDKLLSEY